LIIDLTFIATGANMLRAHGKQPEKEQDNKKKKKKKKKKQEVMRHRHELSLKLHRTKSDSVYLPET
jgi:hypothetical protein